MQLELDGQLCGLLSKQRREHLILPQASNTYLESQEDWFTFLRSIP